MPEGSSTYREASPPIDLGICGDMLPIVLSKVDGRMSMRVLSSPKGGYSHSDSDTESMGDAVSPVPPKSMPDIALPRQPLRIASACIKCESNKDIQRIVDPGFQITELFKNEDDCVLRKPVHE
ncbi:unnamed protein product [Owenia fusiformis]|uniref:Uncharacterized protein n=1 Tax=Owenia fusiformis TaxID=6347 RepID=A0A8J1TGG4_OWEFU|nr:unnamed protein product [Owenia fusiformis]